LWIKQQKIEQSMIWSKKSKENHKQCNINFVLLVPGNVFLAQFSLAPAPD
jgi:hypothetical protein